MPGTNTETPATSDRAQDWRPCPGWCADEHGDPQIEDFEAEDGYRTHFDSISGAWLDEHRSISGRVTREGGQGFDLSISQREHADGFRDEEVVEFTVRANGSNKLLRLTSGEARSLAAMLLRGADRLDLNH